MSVNSKFKKLFKNIKSNPPHNKSSFSPQQDLDKGNSRLGFEEKEILLSPQHSPQQNKKLCHTG